MRPVIRGQRAEGNAGIGGRGRPGFSEAEAPAALGFGEARATLATPWREPGIRAADSFAFTLIEVVCVLAIVAAMLTLVLGAFFSWSRMAGIDDAANLVAAGLDHAREIAITQRCTTRFTCHNETRPGRPLHGVFQILSSSNGLGDPQPIFLPCASSNDLPAEVRFRLPSDPQSQTLDFGSDGCPCNWSDQSAMSNACIRFTLDGTLGTSERVLTRFVDVNQFSGLLRAHREDEP